MGEVNGASSEGLGVVTAKITTQDGRVLDFTAQTDLRVYDGFCFFHAHQTIENRIYHVMLRFVMGMEKGKYELPHKDVEANIDIPGYGLIDIKRGDVFLADSGENPMGEFNYYGQPSGDEPSVLYGAFNFK